MQRNKLSRRRVVAGAAGIGAATILHWPANAAEFSYKLGVIVADGASGDGALAGSRRTRSSRRPTGGWRSPSIPTACSAATRR